MKLGSLSATRRPTVGLALSGGAIRGAAHIGVLKVFERSRLPVDYLAGTSIGALIAALYAFGMPPEEIEKVALDLNWLDVSDFIIPRMGLLSNESMGEFLEKLLGPVSIEEARIPLAIVAADVNTGEKVVFRRGSLARAVMASTCIPGIFTPVQDGERLLVDGMIVENVPVSPLLAWKADVIVGVDLSGERRYKKADDIIDVIMNAIEIAIDTHTASLLKYADVVIRPRVSSFSRTDTDQVPDLIREGERAAEAMLAVVHSTLNRKARSGLRGWMAAFFWKMRQTVYRFWKLLMRLLSRS